MITYSKVGWSLHLPFRIYGSAVPRATPFAALSAGLTAILFCFRHDQFTAAWRHPYPYQIFGFIVGFIIVFRSNFGYSRYWEGRTNLQTMTARWADFVTEVVAFEKASLLQTRDRQECRREADRSKAFADAITHTVSLLHAVCLQHLRGDWDLGNLCSHDPDGAPPPTDATQLHSGLVGFSLIDIFMLRASYGKRESHNKSMPLPVMGGMASVEIADLGGGGETSQEKDMLQAGLDHKEDSSAFWTKLAWPSTGLYMPGAAARANVVYAWVQQLLTERHTEGGINMPAPIVSRSWQMLSEGYHAYEQCRKLSDTPFPFPWAQMVLVLLIIFAGTLPLMVVAFIDKLWLAITIDFFSVQAYWALNEVARDVEDPWVYEPNDLPLARLQYQLNERLLAASTTWRPLTRPERNESRKTLGQAGPGSVKSVAPVQAAFMHPAALQATSLATGIDFNPTPRHPAFQQLDSQPESTSHASAQPAFNRHLEHSCNGQAPSHFYDSDHEYLPRRQPLACSCNGHVVPSQPGNDLERQLVAEIVISHKVGNDCVAEQCQHPTCLG
ncbi:hypothetical protein WJX74_006552 [Apatococcus lobatus]|uniref:Bestrophin n=1 Tax=Apatococcus lobatus TaxID=904363 RepID=A0AAW1R0Y0_9CHLO